jgi:hypothetical protein
MIYSILADNMDDGMVSKDHKKHEVRPYVDLHTVYSKDEVLESDTYKIETFELTKDHVKREIVRTSMDGNGWLTRGLCAEFPYVKLVKKGEGVMMSDTPMERNSNRDFVKQANGDVLIFGLGLGLVILPLLQADEVNSITVVELDGSLIEMVQPILKKHDPKNKLTIVHGDCFQFHEQVPKEQKWDCIYGDIWLQISSDNWEEMKTLTKNFKHKVNRKNPDWMLTHWLKDYVQREWQKEKSTAYGSWW